MRGGLRELYNKHSCIQHISTAYSKFLKQVTLYGVSYQDNKVHEANMWPTWVLSAPDGPHVGPMNLAIRVGY